MCRRSFEILVRCWLRMACVFLSFSTFFSFFLVLRRGRRGFSLTRAHNQCWRVNDYERRCQNNSTFPLPHMLRRNQRIENSQLQQKVSKTEGFPLLSLPKNRSRLLTRNRESDSCPPKKRDTAPLYAARSGLGLRLLTISLCSHIRSGLRS